MPRIIYDLRNGTIINDPVLVVVRSNDPRFTHPNGSLFSCNGYAERDATDEKADELIAKWLPDAIATTVTIEELS